MDLDLDNYETLEDLYDLRSDVLDLLTEIDSKITDKEEENHE